MLERSSLRLSSYAPLEGLKKRPCAQCNKKKMYYCYDCRVPLPGVFVPNVKLPCAVDIVKHRGEKNGKSTALHCKIAAPSQTRVFDYPNLEGVAESMEGDGEGATVVLFPFPSALSIEEFVRTQGKIKRFVVLDCTWNQVNSLKNLPQIQGLPSVSLRKYNTIYWRPQYKKDDTHLATIEAIYYAQREYVEHGLNNEYKGEFDDLFYWFFIGHEKYLEGSDAREKRKLEYEKEKNDNSREELGVKKAKAGE